MEKYSLPIGERICQHIQHACPAGRRGLLSAQLAYPVPCRLTLTGKGRVDRDCLRSERLPLQDDPVFENRQHRAVSLKPDHRPDLCLAAAYHHHSVAQLASVATTISRDQDYSLRVAQLGSDEVGTVIASFNLMLERVQQRDQALISANDDLEIRVQQRTEAFEKARDQAKRPAAPRASSWPT